MPRTPADDARDLARKKRLQQQVSQLTIDSKTKGAWSKPAAVGQPASPGNAFGFKLDHQERHHLVPVEVYDDFIDGMTPDQIKKVDKALEGNGMYKGNNMLNRIDLWKRYHQGRSDGHYQGKGAHQLTSDLGIDGPGGKGKWSSIAPDKRIGMVSDFVSDMSANEKVAQGRAMQSQMLEPGNNASKNPYGGNFSQAVLQPPNKQSVQVNATNTSKMKTTARSQGLNLNRTVKPPTGMKLSGSLIGMLPDVIELGDNHTGGAVTRTLDGAVNGAVDALKSGIGKGIKGLTSLFIPKQQSNVNYGQH